MQSIYGPPPSARQPRRGSKPRPTSRWQQALQGLALVIVGLAAFALLVWLEGSGGGDDDEDELGEHEAQDGAGVVGGGGGVDDGVDDQLAEVGDRGREHAGDEGEAGEHEGERSARRPHQLERAAAVTKYAEEAAQAGLVRWVCHAGEGASKPRGSDNFSAR